MSFRLDQLLDKHWRDGASMDVTTLVPADVDEPSPHAAARRGGMAVITPPALVSAVYVDAETRRLFSLDAARTLYVMCDAWRACADA
jgi:hypothetical protein